MRSFIIYTSNQIVLEELIKEDGKGKASSTPGRREMSARFLGRKREGKRQLVRPIHR
jgi:hypothetical protein